MAIIIFFNYVKSQNMESYSKNYIFTTYVYSYVRTYLFQQEIRTSN